MSGRERFSQQQRRADVDRHVRVEFLGVELAESVPREPRGIVDQQPHRRQPRCGGEDGLRAIRIGQVRHHFHRAFGDRILFVPDMRDDRPAIGEQRARNLRSDALAGPGDDRGSVRLHARRLSLSSGRSQWTEG